MSECLRKNLEHPSVLFYGGVLTDQMMRHLRDKNPYAMAVGIDGSYLRTLREGINWDKALPKLSMFIPKEYSVEKGKLLIYFISPKDSKSVNNFVGHPKLYWFEHDVDNRLNPPGSRPSIMPSGPWTSFESPIFTKVPTVYTGVGLFGKYKNHWTFIEPKQRDQVEDLALVLSSAFTCSVGKNVWEDDRKKLIGLIDAGVYMRGFLSYMKKRICDKDTMVPPIMMSSFPVMSEKKTHLFITAITSKPDLLYGAKISMPSTLDAILCQKQSLAKATSIAWDMSKRYARLRRLNCKEPKPSGAESEGSKKLREATESRLASLEQGLTGVLDEIVDNMDSSARFGLNYF